jgi:heterodisulfide reductase subunit B2
MIRRLLYAADKLDTDAMVTICPMCQLNLDGFQGETNRFFKTDYHIPVLFFTQLMGLAFGIKPRELGFGAELVSARNLLDHLGVEAPPETPPAPPKRPRKPEGLPMPAPLPKSAKVEELEKEVAK